MEKREKFYANPKSQEAIIESVHRSMLRDIERVKTDKGLAKKVLQQAGVYNSSGKLNERYK